VRALALLAAVIAAALIPHAPLGVDVPIVAAIVALAVAGSAPRSLDAVLFGSLALALAGMSAWLDAPWVVVLDLAAAWLLATIAVAGTRLLAPLAPIRALGDAPALVPSPPESWVPAARGALLGSLLVLPFGALFWSADAAFAQIGSSAPWPSASLLAARLFVFVLVLLAGLGLALAARKVFSDPILPAGPKLGLTEWAIPLLLLDVLFLAFVVVQATVLFGGHRHVLETAGLTYSEYARQGFWQLIVVAALALGVIAAALRLASVHRASDRFLLRALIGALCLLTLVIVASAVHRLQVYEDAFGLTRERLAAETFALGLAGFFVLVLLAGLVPVVRSSFGRIVMAGSAAGLLAFSLSNPDGRIAARNVDRWRTTGDLDIVYVQSLSADAVPVLATLPAPLRDRVLAPFQSRLAEGDPWSSANRSRHRARAVLRDPG
jgi:hypothetical protein